MSDVDARHQGGHTPATPAGGTSPSIEFPRAVASCTSGVWVESPRSTFRGIDTTSLLGKSPRRNKRSVDIGLLLLHGPSALSQPEPMFALDDPGPSGPSVCQIEADAKRRIDWILLHRVSHWSDEDVLIATINYLDVFMQKPKPLTLQIWSLVAQLFPERRRKFSVSINDWVDDASRRGLIQTGGKLPRKWVALAEHKRVLNHKRWTAALSADAELVPPVPELSPDNVDTDVHQVSSRSAIADGASFGVDSVEVVADDNISRNPSSVVTMIHVPPPDINHYHDPSEDAQDTEWSQLLSAESGIIMESSDEEESETRSAAPFEEVESSKAIRLIIQSRKHSESSRRKPAASSETLSNVTDETPKVRLKYRPDQRTKDKDRPTLWSEAAKTLDSIQPKKKAPPAETSDKDDY